MGVARKYPEICTIEGCDRPHEAKGMCHRHYKADRRKNDKKVREARRIEKAKYRKKPDVKKKLKQKMKEYRANPDNAIKIKCNNAFNRAIKKGEIERQPCEKCGKPDALGHHDDYSEPLEVRWMCDEHHQEYHNQLCNCAFLVVNQTDGVCNLCNRRRPQNDY